MGDLLDHDVAEVRVGTEAPADPDVHRLDELAVDPLEHAFDADVGDLVLRAARGAAGEVDAQVLAVPVGADVGVQEGGDLRRALLGEHLGQAAELLAGARLHAAGEQRRVGAELVAHERLVEQGRHALVGHVRDQHVLLMGQADLAGAVLAGERDHAVELVAAQPPDRHAQTDRGVAPVALPGDADVVVAAEVGCVRRAAGQRTPDPPLELGAERLGPDAVEQELHAGLAARLAVLLGVAEDRGDCSTTSGASSGVRKTSTQRANRGTADSPPPTRRLKPRVPSAAIAPESATSLMSPRAQSSAQPVTLILNLRGRLEKARLPSRCGCSGHGRRVAVDDLVVRDPGHRAADDVAGDVAARPGRRQADRLEPAQDLGHRLERDPVDLHALAGGAVQHAAAVVLGDPGQDLGLIARQDALDDLHAQHEVAVLRVVLVEPVPLEAEEVVVARARPAPRSLRAARPRVRRAGPSHA